MAGGSEKNTRKRNSRRARAAEGRLREAQEELDMLRRKPNKTHAERVRAETLERTARHQRKKVESKFEIHSRVGKRH
jgi:hypothetical protein